MEELSKFSNEDVKRAAEGVLWNIRSLTENEEKSRRDKQKGSTDFEPVYKHVMLSYSWAHKPVVKLIKEELKKAGYTTWLDEDQMSELA